MELAHCTAKMVFTWVAQCGILWMYQLRASPTAGRNRKTMRTNDKPQNGASSPHCIRVREWLLAHIKKHNLGAGDKIPSERYLADALGISRLTVGKAINELVDEGMLMQQSRSGTFVAGRTFERPKSRGNSVALIMPGGPGSDELNGRSGFSLITQGVSMEMVPQGYRMVVHYYHYLGDEMDILRALAGGEADCAIILPSFFQHNYLLYSQLIPQHPPVVLVDHYFPRLPIDRVVTDNFAGARDAVRVLISRGHRRIACLSEFFGPVTSVRDRIAGYRAALEEAGVAYDEELVCGPQALPNGNNSFEYALEHMTRISDPITAVFAMNENVIWMLQHAAAKLSLVIGRDVELAGFHDAAVPTGAQTPFIRVVQSKLEIGQTAAWLLLDRISGRAPAEPQHTRVCQCGNFIYTSMMAL